MCSLTHDMGLEWKVSICGPSAVTPLDATKSHTLALNSPTYGFRWVHKGPHECLVCVGACAVASSSQPGWCPLAVSLLAPFFLTLNKTPGHDSDLHVLFRAKGFQHQRMTNGAMNVEIGNPAYKIYEGEPDDDAGELLDADFTLDPDKVESSTRRACVCKGVSASVCVNNIWFFLLLSSLLTSQTQCMPLSTWEPTTAATLWQAQMRRKSCYHVVMKSPLWTPWHSRSAWMKWYQTHPSSCLVKRKKWNKKINMWEKIA